MHSQTVITVHFELGELSLLNPRLNPNEMVGK